MLVSKNVMLPTMMFIFTCDSLRIVCSQLNKTNLFLAGCQAVFIVLFGIFGGDRMLSADYFGGSATRALDGYNLYIGVMIMMLIGFGYLMTFLKFYGLGAVGFCLLVTALGLQWGLLIEAFFTQVWANEWSAV